MAVALTLFNDCSKEEAVEIPETEGNPFALVATPESRTVNEGLNTVWAENDGVNVFHAVAGTTAYTSDGEFTIAAADIEAGKFTGKLGGALNEAAYDWYMFYPYSEYITTPANTSSGYMAIGSKATDSQTQTGNNSMAHIAGENYPLYGKAVGVAAVAVPSITMHQAAALVAVNVTNPATASDAITVSTVELTAPEDIVGTYYIDFASDKVVYTPSNTKYVSNTAKLNVENGTALNPGESAKFYLGVKPFELNNGALTIKVTDGKGMTYEKTTEGLTASFTSGKIKTVNFELAEGVAPVDYSGEYIAVVKKGTSYVYLTTAASGSRLATANSGVAEITDYTKSSTDFPEVPDAYIWKVEKVEGSPYHRMKADNLFIKKVTTSSNSAYSTTDFDSAEPLAFSYNADLQSYTIASTSAGYEGRVLAVNESSDYYAFYAANTTQLKEIVLIPYVPDMTPKLDAPVVTATGNAANKTIDITWSAITSATQYVVHYKKEGAEAGSQEVVNEPATSYTLNVPDYGTYVITVEASALGYRSAKSEEVRVELNDPSVQTVDVEFVVGTDITGDNYTLAEGASKNGVTVAFAKAAGTTFKYYTPVRLYGGNTLTVSGVGITKIEVIFVSGYVKTLLVDSGTFSVSGTTGTWICADAGGVSNVVMQNGTSSSISQARISKIVVTYIAQ